MQIVLGLGDDRLNRDFLQFTLDKRGGSICEERSGGCELIIDAAISVARAGPYNSLLRLCLHYPSFILAFTDPFFFLSTTASGMLVSQAVSWLDGHVLYSAAEISGRLDPLRQKSSSQNAFLQSHGYVEQHVLDSDQQLFTLCLGDGASFLLHLRRNYLAMKSTRLAALFAVFFSKPGEASQVKPPSFKSLLPAVLQRQPSIG